MHPPISKGFLLVSGPLVVCKNGETLTCGFGGSDLNCLLAFLKVCPTVFTPMCCVPVMKFTPVKSPSVGVNEENLVASFDGRRSCGDN